MKSVVPEIKVPGRRFVGFVLDGNSFPQQSWGEFREKLVEAGFSPPLNLNPDGVILKDESGPAVGVWLMPDNGSSGEIEDFVIEMIMDNDPVWPLAQSYIDGIPEEYRKFPPIKSDKAKLYAWLSARKKPSRMGATIGAGDLNTETQLNSSFMSWLSNLFGQV